MTPSRRRLLVLGGAAAALAGRGRSRCRRRNLIPPAGRAAFGHTGFTGTSIVLRPRRKVVLVLLTDRVHPDAACRGDNAARKAAADALAG